jgi:hypothetical protein
MKGMKELHACSKHRFREREKREGQRCNKYSFLYLPLSGKAYNKGQLRKEGSS